MVDIGVLPSEESDTTLLYQLPGWLAGKNYVDQLEAMGQRLLYAPGLRATCLYPAHIPYPPYLLVMLRFPDALAGQRVRTELQQVIRGITGARTRFVVIAPSS